MTSTTHSPIDASAPQPLLREAALRGGGGVAELEPSVRISLMIAAAVITVTALISAAIVLSGEHPVLAVGLMLQIGAGAILLTLAGSTRGFRVVGSTQANALLIAFLTGCVAILPTLAVVALWLMLVALVLALTVATVVLVLVLIV